MTGGFSERDQIINQIRKDETSKEGKDEVDWPFESKNKIFLRGNGRERRKEDRGSWRIPYW